MVTKYCLRVTCAASLYICVINFICQCGYTKSELDISSTQESTTHPGNKKTVRSVENKSAPPADEKTLSLSQKTNIPTEKITTTLEAPDSYSASDPSLCKSWCIVLVDGWLKPDIRDSIVLEKLGPPDKKGQSVYEESTNLYLQTWWYNSLGLMIEMSSENQDSTMSVNLISVFSPGKFKTAGGIGIGSPYNKVKQLYGDKSNPDYSNETRTIIGSIYWGTIFEFSDKKVSEITIGAIEE